MRRRKIDPRPPRGPSSPNRIGTVIYGGLYNLNMPTSPVPYPQFPRIKENDADQAITSSPHDHVNLTHRQAQFGRAWMTALG
jgi:hypothetical protein